LWDTLDNPRDKPALTESSETVITPLTGEWAGWTNYKMKFVVPGPGHVICAWGWNNGYEIQSDYTAKLAYGDDAGEVVMSGDHPLNVEHWLSKWTIALHVKGDGQGNRYYIDNFLFYPEGSTDKIADNLNVNFGLDFYWPADIYTVGNEEGPTWVLLPTMNGDQ